jgi:hypothetical protein
VDKVIDLEVAAETPSPTVDPSVRTILIGHSMGGIVAAEALFSIATDKPIANVPGDDDIPIMFPSLIGVLAFDTPYLGIAPGVFAHGVEGHLNTASTVVGQLSGLAGAMGWGAAASGDKAGKQGMKAIEAAAKAQPKANAKNDAGWQWGKMAMIAGAASAVAAGGAAAYMKRDTIGEGWGWATSHLEFVGCLMKGAELEARMKKIDQVEKERGTKFAVLFTALGKGADGQGAGPAGVSVVGNVGLLPKERTFCSLPKSGLKRYFAPTVNDKASDEIGAHMSKFCLFFIFQQTLCKC